jgi:hypothetical protein
MRLQPFCFIIVPPNQRDALADAFEAAERELDPASRAINSSALARRRITRRHYWP